MRQQIKVIKIHPDAKVPSYGSEKAAGFDLYAIEDVAILPKEVRLIRTGLKFEIPEGYEVQIRPRSGMSLKTPFRIANTPGTIDEDYRGEICIIGESDGYFMINKGDRIAQGVLAPVTKAEFLLVDNISDTERAEGGFGSSGK